MLIFKGVGEGWKERKDRDRTEMYEQKDRNVNHSSFYESDETRPTSFLLLVVVSFGSPVVGSLRPRGLYSPSNSPGQNIGVGSLSLLQGIFPTQGSNPGLLHCRRNLYQLSHKGSPRILERVAYAFFSRSSQPRNPTRSPALQVDSLPTELSGKPNTIKYNTEVI